MALTEQEIYAELTKIFRHLFKNPTLELAADTSPAQIGYWNSFAQVNIVLAVEDRFEFEIHTDELRSLKTIGDFARLITARSGLGTLAK